MGVLAESTGSSNVCTSLRNWFVVTHRLTFIVKVLHALPTQCYQAPMIEVSFAITYQLVRRNGVQVVVTFGHAQSR